MKTRLNTFITRSYAAIRGLKTEGVCLHLLWVTAHRLKYRNDVRLFGIAALAAVIGACAGSGTVDLSVQGIKAESAVSLLSDPSKPEAIDSALVQLGANISPSFEWDALWTGVRTKKTLAHLSSQQQKRLLEFGDKSCIDEHFTAFVDLILDTGIGVEFIAGPKAKCRVILGPTRTKKILQLLNLSSAEESQWAARLVTSQWAANPAADWRPVASLLTEKEWQSLADTLIQNDQNALLAEIGSFYETVRGDSAAIIGDTVTAAVLDGSVFATTISRLGLEKLLKHSLTDSVLRKIISVTDKLPRDERKQKLLRFLNQIGDSFSSSLRQQEINEATFFDAWNVFRQMRRLEQKISSQLARKQESLSATETLIWLEKLHRELESNLLRSGSRGLEILDSAGTPSLDRSWLRLRLALKLHTTFENVLTDLPESDPGSTLDNILAARLAVHAANAPGTRHSNIASFCALLSHYGVPTTIVRDSDGLKTWLENDRLPGCLKFVPGNTPSPAKTLTSLQIRASALPFDSALLAPDSDLRISSESFDGGLFDLSSEWSWPAIRVAQNPAADADAIAFPVIIGFQLEKPFGPNKPGVHYFVLHLPARPAKDGLVHPIQAQDGAMGGNLTLEVQNSGSVPPIVVSLGGPGQKGGQTMKGGRSSHSEINPMAVASFLRNMDLAGVLATRGEKPIFHPNPDPVTAHAIFQQAASGSDGKTKTYMIGPEYLRILSPEQQQKVQLICAESPTLDTCFTNVLGKMAWAYFAATMARTASDELPDNFNSAEFTLPAGADGPVNPDGACGNSGAVNLKGFAR